MSEGSGGIEVKIDFFDLFNNSPICIEIYDKDGIVIKMNDAGYKFWGLTKNSRVVGNYNLFEDEQVKN